MFDPTLNGIIAQIEAGKIVLPAMQRPFVWKDDRITLNKSNVAPHLWFSKPGDQAPYSDADLDERLLSKDMLRPGKFGKMLKERQELIQKRALALFRMNSVEDVNALFDSNGED